MDKHLEPATRGLQSLLFSMEGLKVPLLEMHTYGEDPIPGCRYCPTQSPDNSMGRRRKSLWVCTHQHQGVPLTNTMEYKEFRGMEVDWLR